MSKKKHTKDYIAESVSVVRDNFSKYLNSSSETSVIVLQHNQPKSVLISYADFNKYILKNKEKPFTAPRNSKKKYDKYEDFLGIANPSHKKIDIKKEIQDAWTRGY